jgi:hypothetical protein
MSGDTTRVRARDYRRMTQPERRVLRLQYVEQQGGMCWHCKSPLKGPPSHDVARTKIRWSLFPPNFLQHSVHLHHNHVTGKTIGAVHAYCNAYLWQEEGQ